MAKGEKTTLVGLLRQKVKGSGLAVGVLSRRCDVPATTLYQLAEGDRVNVSTKTVEKLLDYFNLEVTEAKGARK
jgi:predicted transcriptional regulator